MDSSLRRVVNIFSRYILVLILGMGNLYVFYKLLTPLTINTVHLILSIFTTSQTVGNLIFLQGATIEIVASCIAGSAFYLLFLLIFTTPKISPKKRIYATLTALAALFTLNVLRILILIPFVNTSYFYTLHWIFWHLISTIFVVGIWFATVYFYKIKGIPVYSDIKFMIQLILPKKKTKHSKTKKSSKKKSSKSKTKKKARKKRS